MRCFWRHISQPLVRLGKGSLGYQGRHCMEESPPPCAQQQDSLRSYPWSQYPQICKGQIWVAARARMFTHTHAAFTVFVLGQYKCPGAIVLIATCSPAPYQNIANLNTPQTLIDWHPIFFTKSFNSCKDIISVTSLFKCVMGSRCLSDLIATCPFKTSMSRLHINI